MNRKLKATMELCLNSYINDYHTYNEIWTAVMGEVLLTNRELHNEADSYAVAVKKHSDKAAARAPTKENIGIVYRHGAST